MYATRNSVNLIPPVGFPEAVPALSNLEQLHLRWGDAGMPVHVPAMTTLQRMQSCILEGEGTGAYMVDSLSTLTGLKTLHLNVMALQNIPTWYVLVLWEYWNMVARLACTIIMHTGYPTCANSRT